VKVFTYGRRAVLAWLAAIMVMLGVSAQAQGPLRGYDRAAGYQYVAFGQYPQGETGERMPILWRVLAADASTAYLMSDRILLVRRIDGDQWNYKGWAHSELHAWLNDAFAADAFSQEEQAALVQQEELGRVSLPSSDDIKNAAYGFADDGSRRLEGTAYARSQGLYVYSGRSYSPIWTRTPSQRTHAHRSTKSGGAIGFIGVESDDLGVAPVIWLNTAGIDIAGGSGTQKDPYRLTAGEQTP